MADAQKNVIYFRFVDNTPVGRLLLACDDQGLRFLCFDQGQGISEHQSEDEVWTEDDGQLDEPVRQLQAYFRGERHEFDLPLAARGTAFQKKVWDALSEIPFGETMTYGEIAERIGQPSASRAVGLANGRNPISIVVPCHRVIGSNGRLVGFGGGLARKLTLLRLEGFLPLLEDEAPALAGEQADTVARQAAGTR